jgi:hypothetical protein
MRHRILVLGYIGMGVAFVTAAVGQVVPCIDTNADGTWTERTMTVKTDNETKTITGFIEAVHDGETNVDFSVTGSHGRLSEKVNSIELSFVGPGQQAQVALPLTSVENYGQKTFKLMEVRAEKGVLTFPGCDVKLSDEDEEVVFNGTIVFNKDIGDTAATATIAGEFTHFSKRRTGGPPSPEDSVGAKRGGG